MKKVFIASALFLTTGLVSSFTTVRYSEKNNTAQLISSTDKKDQGTADARLANTDKKDQGTADARLANTDKKDQGTADAKLS